jgi:hypothetical protein
MNDTTLDLFEAKARMEDELKFLLCEEFASEMEVSTDYIYAEFVDPNRASFAEVQFVLSRF